MNTISNNAIRLSNGDAGNGQIHYSEPVSNYLHLSQITYLPETEITGNIDAVHNTSHLLMPQSSDPQQKRIRQYETQQAKAIPEEQQGATPTSTEHYQEELFWQILQENDARLAD